MADGDRCAMRPGDEEVAAFLDAVLQCRSQLIRNVGYLCGSWEDAEDIVQVSLMKAYSNLHQFRGEAQMKTWLGSIARNAALEYRRSRRGVKPMPLEPGREGEAENLAIEPADPRPTPEEWCERRERAEMVLKGLEQLSAHSRTAIELCVLEERTQVEAAKMLRVTVGTMKSRIFRGKQGLQEALSAAGD